MNVRSVKIGQQRLKLRRELWPNVPEERIWDKTRRKGFTTIPRVMPYFLRIMDSLTKNQPVSQTYMALWCRGFDEGLVQINAPEIAFESGFSGQRAVQTWMGRIKLLRDLGFILTGSGASGELSFALILDPYLLINEFRQQGRIENQEYNGLIARMSAVGAGSLDR
jgi:hypothetical protein